MRESTVCDATGRPRRRSNRKWNPLAACERAFDPVPSDELRRGLVLGVSGGADSTALALLCATSGLRDRVGRLTIASIDHGQRPESAAEVEQVADLAARLDVAFATRRLELATGADEATMRRARFAALHAIAQRVGSRVLALGHHADDVIETVVFRQRRGTGIRGLAGIPAHRRTAAGLHLVRPLLELRHADLVGMCREHGIDPVDDPSNRALDRARSRLRHLTLPQLRERAANREAFDRAILAVADAARRITARTVGRAHRFCADALQGGGVGSDWALDLHPDGAVASDRVLSEVLRQIHIASGLGAPGRHWLTRAVALRHAPAGRRLAGRGRGLLVLRTSGGFSISTNES